MFELYRYILYHYVESVPGARGVGVNWYYWSEKRYASLTNCEIIFYCHVPCRKKWLIVQAFVYCFTQTESFFSGNCTSTETEKGDCCVFPFNYKGATYHSCTFVDGFQPWCSLTSDYDTDKKFGYCAFKSK